MPEPLHGEALVALDKLDKIGADGVAQEFAARGIRDAAGAPGALVLRAGGARDPATRCSRAWRACWANTRRCVNLTAIVGLAAATPAAGRIRVDPSLARGLSYYTGAIMEIAVEGIGSLGGGGRYDNLVGMFLGRDVPACGFSLGLERIIVVMTERNMFPPSVAGGAVDVAGDTLERRVAG